MKSLKLHLIPTDKPKQIKCYCGHTITCDCSPLEEPKQSIIKTEEDAKIFIEALENTPEPNEKLKKAFKNFHKQETLEEAAEDYVKSLNLKVNVDEYKEYAINDFIAGAKWQQERSYSEEDLRNAYRWGTTVNHGTKEHFNEWFEQFKKKV